MKKIGRVVAPFGKTEEEYRNELAEIIKLGERLHRALLADELHDDESVSIEEINGGQVEFLPANMEVKPVDFIGRLEKAAKEAKKTKGE